MRTSINMASFFDELSSIKEAAAPDLPSSYYSSEMPGVSQQMVDDAHKRVVMQGLSGAMRGGVGGLMSGAVYGGLSGALKGKGIADRIFNAGIGAIDMGRAFGPLGAGIGGIRGITSANETQGNLVEGILRKKGITDEEGEVVEKDAAQKSRKGSCPIRAHNLAKKKSYDGRGKRVTKLATPRLLMDLFSAGSKAAPAAKGLTPLAKKNLAILGLGGASGFAGKGEVDKYMLGRRIHEAQNR